MKNFSFDAADRAETILIVGAGATGLMAARLLSASGMKIILLEAGEKAGGRIRTLQDPDFPLPVEAGAEFVHGDLPLTLGLLKMAKIPFHAVQGKMINVRKGRQAGRRDNPEGWGELMKKMQELKEDMPLSLFLDKEFPGSDHTALRDSARRFAEGFDLADIRKVSTRALYREWSDEEQVQYRIEGGYGRLIDWLQQKCIDQGCMIQPGTPVQQINWERNKVAMITQEGRVYTGDKAIVTVPLGMLQADGAESIRIRPVPREHILAAGKMGYGTVVKILLQFTNRFWDKREKKLGFVISDEVIPTWWTQYPDKNPLLTGWLPGPVIQGLDRSLPEYSLSSLSNIFHIDIEELRRELIATRVFDWFQVPHIRGGYSFETVDSDDARAILSQPIQNTLFFAGEALHEGYSPGTVEAALHDGKRVAGLMHTDRAKP